jgi:hypothetical protein
MKPDNINISVKPVEKLSKNNMIAITLSSRFARKFNQDTDSRIRFRKNHIFGVYNGNGTAQIYGLRQVVIND